MRGAWRRRSAWILAFGAGLFGLVWIVRPRPIPVDLATLVREPMEITVDDEAITRVRHIYTVSAPISGTVLRISHPAGAPGVSRHVGDEVTAHVTVVAVMQPTTPAFLDARSREELTASIRGADAAVKQAEAEVQRIGAVLALSHAEFRRAENLAHSDTISRQAFDEIKFEVDGQEAALASAKAQLEVQRSLRASLAARLIGPTQMAAPTGPDCCIEIRAPASGRVLRIVQDSEAVVPVGAPLIEIGDPLDLEIVADLLSTDAVQVVPGAPVHIDGWGGPAIAGRVKRVDPAGFVKVSALGIEEQRVPTTIDFVDPPELRSRLGHDFRVVVHITVWRAEDVLTVPVGALFRSGDQWAVFAIRDGRARITPLQIDHRNNRSAEVLSGASAGDQVVLHPSDRIKDGVSVSVRESR